ncbi:MAG: HEAT repeat domain-containing protein [Myxococcales bacterium]|nr:HEAT repeat domain-containing protein [Myxococcales bacterium]
MRRALLAGSAMAICLGALALLMTSCPKRSGDPERSRKVEVYRVEITDRTPPAHRVSVTQDKLEAFFKKRLEKSGQVYVTSLKKHGAYRVAVEVGMRPDGSGGLAALVVARARPHRSDALTLQSSTLTHLRKPPVGKPTEADRRKHLLDALARVADDLAFQARLARAKPKEIIEALSATTDKARLGAAIEITAVRGVKEAGPALIKLLHHAQEEIADRAIGALVSIRERRAVKPLTRLASFKDTRRLAKVIDAIGTIGGKEARQYLEFVAVGHPDADIKNLAREALVRMKRPATVTKK